MALPGGGSLQRARGDGGWRLAHALVPLLEVATLRAAGPQVAPAPHRTLLVARTALALVVRVRHVRTPRHTLAVVAVRQLWRALRHAHALLLLLPPHVTPVHTPRYVVLGVPSTDQGVQGHGVDVEVAAAGVALGGALAGTPRGVALTVAQDALAAHLHRVYVAPAMPLPVSIRGHGRGGMRGKRGCC